MQFIGIIPARYASTRFPGKPLVDLCGKTMIQRVYEQANNVLDTVIVATDDQRIYDCVKAFGGNVFMTSPDHQCGTDRVYEAYTLYREQTQCTLPDSEVVVVNIQGDEPFIQPDQIQALMHCFPTEIATLVHPFTKENTWDDLSNPNYVKVVTDQRGRALYFSRAAIPFQRDVERSEWTKHHTYLKHIGIYAFRAEVLKAVTDLPQSTLELSESLEQLRWLENGYKIGVGITQMETIGIDTPEDLERAEQFLKEKM